MITAAITLSFGGSLLLFGVLLLIAVGLSLFFYRTTLPPLPPRRRLLFSALRALALSLILLAIFEPVLRLVRTEAIPATVAVLVDVSQSMAIRSGGRAGDRPMMLRQALHAPTLLPNGIRAEFFSFDGKLARATPSLPDSLPLTGELTNIAAAFAGLKNQIQERNIQSVLLLSDGNYTAGRNPLYDAEALGVPVSTVGIGDTAEERDILIENVSTNTVAYAGMRVPVDVTVRSSGYGGENVEVTLRDGATVVDRRLLTLTPGTNEYPLRLTAEPKEEGTSRFTVNVSALPGELTERNNVHSFYMKVLRSKLRVVLFAGSPTPDVAAIRQAAAEDERITVSAYVQKSPGEFYEGPPPPSSLDSADCLIFVGFPSAATDGATVKLLADLFEREHTPLLFVNGKGTDFATLRSFEGVLPFTWTNLAPGETYVFPLVSDPARNHPLVTLGDAVAPDAWQHLPPIYRGQTTFRAKPEATVLATMSVQNVPIGEPLVAVRSVARQKSFAITGYGIWRWRLSAQGTQGLERFLPLLTSNVIRWLTTREENKNVRIAPVKESFTTAEPVEFEAEVYDEQLRPVDRATVTVELTHGKERFQLQLTAVGNGRYEGSLDGLGEGSYAFSGKAVADGRALGEDKGKFSVGQVNAEFIETKMNKTLLEQIAYRTGGQYYDAADAGAAGGEMARAVKFADREQVQAAEIELWNWPYLTAAILLLFAIEWYVRKRAGML
jgi:hypothetical protein